MFLDRILGLRTCLSTLALLPIAFFLGCEPGSEGGGMSGEVVMNLPSEASIDAALASITEEEIRGVHPGAGIGRVRWPGPLVAGVRR